ncbi:MAG: macro domain-containing protein [Gammaproteobacteria bacterium]|jgi:O-acetyl-ADP-ribose deacetylase
MDKTTMRFLFGDRELVLTAGDVLSAKVDAIANPAGNMLDHQAALAQRICQQAGSQIECESAQLIREYGAIDAGMAVYTSAGDLPFKAIIHAVVPEQNVADAGRLLEQAISRSLQLCDMNEWYSLAIPVVDMEAAGLTLADVAQAYFRAITRFWDARHDCALEKVCVYVTPEQFRAFFDAFREEGLTEETEAGPIAADNGEESIGEIDLSEADIADLDDSDINNWFK